MSVVEDRSAGRSVARPLARPPARSLGRPTGRSDPKQDICIGGERSVSIEFSIRDASSGKVLIPKNNDLRNRFDIQSSPRYRILETELSAVVWRRLMMPRERWNPSSGSRSLTS